MAVVYRAEHRRRKTVHAVKILNASLARDRDLRRRFLEEGRLQARLHHPSIVPVTDTIETPEVTGLVMPLLQGQSLRQRLCGQPVAPELAVPWMLQVLSALDAVHAQGVVHRDLKPSNLFLERRADGDRVWIMDFGIAKVLGSELTQLSAPIGTLRYMSPEHIRSMKAVDHRTDIYAMGAILYELLCGAPAFEAENAYILQQRIEQGQRVPLGKRASGIPQHLAAAAARAMSLDRSDRFASAADFAAALVGPPVTHTVRVPDPTARIAPWAAQGQQLRDGFRRWQQARQARRAYTEKLWQSLQGDMSLGAAQVRTLTEHARELGLPEAEVSRIHARVTRRVLLQANARLRWQQLRGGLAAMAAALGSSLQQAGRRRAQRTAKRRARRPPSAKPSLTKRFADHVSGDVRSVWDDAVRVPWRGYGLKLKYGIREEPGGLIQRLYSPPSRLALPVAKLFGILKWDTLGWHWRDAMRESRKRGIWPVLEACARTPPLVVGGVLVTLIRLLVALCAVTLGLLLAGPWYLDFYLRNREP